MLAPRTTTWSPIFRIPHLRVGVVRRRQLRRQGCPDARTAGGRATSGEPPILLDRPDGWFHGAGSADPVLERVRRGGGARADAELGEDVADVPFDRLLAEGQLGGDGPVAVARRNEREHLDLARAQPTRRRGR